MGRTLVRERPGALHGRPPDWTVETYAAHNEAMRAADKRFQKERDRRYKERDQAQKLAVAAALSAAEKAAEKTEVALKEYKVGANEWRSTVADLISKQAGQSQGMASNWQAIAIGVAILVSLLTIGAFVFRSQPAAVQPQMIMMPAPPGTTIPVMPPQQAPR